MLAGITCSKYVLTSVIVHWLDLQCLTFNSNELNLEMVPCGFEAFQNSLFKCHQTMEHDFQEAFA